MDACRVHAALNLHARTSPGQKYTDAENLHVTSIFAKIFSFCAILVKWIVPMNNKVHWTIQVQAL